MSRISEALRCCAMSDCEHCPYDAEPICPSTTELMNMAADALEAADKRIAELEAQNELTTKCNQLQAEVDNYEKRIAELEAQIPKEGEWIEQDDGNSIYHKCSVCGKNQYNVLLEMMQGDYHYCPNCGARMRGEQE